MLTPVHAMSWWPLIDYDDDNNNNDDDDDDEPKYRFTGHNVVYRSCLCRIAKR